MADDAGCPSPYMYEPLARQGNQSNLSEQRARSSDPPSPGIPINRPRGICTCQHCLEMESEEENVCCKSYTQVSKILENGPICITEHPGFQGNCLNRWVLEASIYEFTTENGLLGDEESIPEMLRYLAYRRFVRWVFGRLGRYNRRVIPACCVIAIRNAFPADFYHGFRHAIQ